MLVASFDLETTNLSANFGALLCAVVQPWGGRQIVLRVDDFGGIGSDDSRLVEATVNELSQYKILIAHNGIKFDRPFLNTRATKYGLPQLDPRGNFIDPVVIARRHLRLSYNGLDSIAKYLRTKHQKTPVDPAKWVAATMDHDTAALDDIVTHCKNDVYVLQEVTERLLPFIGRITEFGSS